MKIRKLLSLITTKEGGIKIGTIQNYMNRRRKDEFCLKVEIFSNKRNFARKE
jgi:hypothetical protein